MKNEKDIYLKNNLKISQKWNDDRGNLLRNDADPIHQYKSLQNFSLSNRFTAVKSIKGQLFTFNSSVNLNRTPQDLSVTPGQFENVFTDSLPYERVRQVIGFSSFSTDNHISFVKPVRRLTLIPKVGVLLQNQVLASEVSINATDDTKTLNNDFRNLLRFNTTEVYAEVKAQYKNPKLRVDINLPLRLRNYQILDKVRHLNNQLTTPTFEPRGFAIYTFNNYLEITASSGYGRQFGSIGGLYNAYLLTSYRNLQRFNGNIPQSSSWNNGLSVNYRNTTKALFANLSHNVYIQKNKHLFKNIIDASGFNTLEMIYQDNMQGTQSISGDVSKFFLNIKTIVKLSGSLNFSNSDYLLNDKLDVINTTGYNAGFSVNNNTFKHLNFSYETRMGLSKSKLSERKVNDISFSNHLIGLDILPNDNQIFTIKGEYYATNLETQSNQTFVDLKYLIKIPKRKVDIELSCINLLNNQTYVRLHQSEFSTIRNYFELRPRQFMATTRFKF